MTDATRLERRLTQVTRRDGCGGFTITVAQAIKVLRREVELERQRCRLICLAHPTETGEQLAERIKLCQD